jgi:hypothetical protein
MRETESTVAVQVPFEWGEGKAAGWAGWAQQISAKAVSADFENTRSFESVVFMGAWFFIGAGVANNAGQWRRGSDARLRTEAASACALHPPNCRCIA